VSQDGDEADWVQPEIIGPGGPGRLGGPGRPGGPDGPGTSAGPRPARRPPGSPLQTRWALGVLGVVVLVVAVTAVLRRTGRDADADHALNPTGSGATATSSVTDTAASSALATRTALGGASTGPLTGYTPRTLPGAFARLQEKVTVYGFSPGSDHHPPTVVRLDLATGIEVDTPLPPLQSTGPVSVIAQPHGVIVRPLDWVPGYQVIDGQPPGPLPGRLADGGPALPGPVPGSVWTAAGGRSDVTTMTLVDESGRDLGRSITLGPDAGFPYSDGAGGIVVVRSNGRIVALADDPPTGPGPARTAPTTTEIGTGQLIAAGPTGYLYRTCGADQRCPLRYVGRDGQPIGSVTLPVDQGTVLGGALAPDGRHAALAVQPAPPPGAPPPGDAPVSALVLVNLVSHTSTLVRWITPNPRSGAASLAWLPDSSWLLVATGGTDIEAVAPDLKRGTGVGIVNVPYLTHLAVRPGG